MDENKRPYTLHDTPTKNQFIGSLKAGLSVKEAASLYDLSLSTAYNIADKYEKTGTASRRPHPGRPKKLTDRDKRMLTRNAKRNRRTPFAELANSLQLNVSASTVRRALGEKGFHRRVALRRPHLRKAQKQSRMRWMRMYRQWGEEDWGKVEFSDECYIHLDDKQGRVWVTRRVDEALEDDCLVSTFSQSTIRVMVWAVVMLGQKGPLVVLDYPGGKGGGMNTQRYREQVLEGALLDFHTRMKAVKGNVIFQQDNAPSHKSKGTKQWLASHGIPLLFHPSGSPDLNPIEPVWHELKTRLRALAHRPTSVESLKQAVRQVWEDIPIEDIDKHIRRMPDRVEAVRAAHGGHTNF
ncbi:putative DDE superfamily endonuclease [Lyophyllum shimeji]|uniref:DDE superfamily endonuclease n=1 Tax=Lyophyllum shimeji TaxID=47721 RepID=A0A9P3UJX1_LYOSH|nr:putative DDE superfamily endonuclease [Lyophyllum shimeji]